MAEGAPPNTLAFLKLVTSDMEQAEAFYTGAFGMRRTTQMEAPGFQEVMLATPDGGFTLVLFHWTDGRSLEHGTRHGPIGFVTDEFEAAMDQAVAHGATIERGPFAFPGAKVAFFRSPEGHEIELMWRGPAEQAA